MKVIEVRFTDGRNRQGLFVFPLRPCLFDAAALREQWPAFFPPIHHFYSALQSLGMPCFIPLQKGAEEEGSRRYLSCLIAGFPVIPFPSATSTQLGFLWILLFPQIASR